MAKTVRHPLSRYDDAKWLRMKKKPRHYGTTTIRTVDLFAGCGGLSLGIGEACRRMKFKHSIELALEWDQDALDILDFNLKPKNTLCADILDHIDGKLGAKKLTKNEQNLINNYPNILNVDILSGGPPCQGYSNLNNHTRGDDDRNELYLRMVRAAEILKPISVIIENVQSVTRSKSQVVQRAEKHLKKIGYHVDSKVMKGVENGVPQMRKRHFLLASRDHEVDFEMISTIPRKQDRTLKWAIDDLKYLNGKRKDKFSVANQANDVNQSRMNWLIENDKYVLPNYLRPKCHQNGHTYPAVYGRMYWNKPSPTITSGFMCNGRGRFTHPFAYPARTLSPHEAARVQTFPDWFDFNTEKRSVITKTLGNAVPPILAMNVTFLLFHSLNNSIYQIAVK